MTRDQAKEKVRKLLRLGKSSNVHEAGAALRQAQALMRLHAIEEGDVAERSPDEIGECSARPRRGSSTAVDIVSLGNLIAKTFGVRVFWMTGRKWSRTGFVSTQAEHFVGPESRRDLAVYAFEVLLRQLLRDKRAHLRRVKVKKNREARGDEFGIGWVFGVSRLLEPWAVSDDERTRIAVWIQQAHPDMGQADVGARKSRAVTFADRAVGRDAGAKAQLNRGVGGSRQGQLEAPKP